MRVREKDGQRYESQRRPGGFCSYDKYCIRCLPGNKTSRLLRQARYKFVVQLRLGSEVPFLPFPSSPTVAETNDRH